MNSTIFYIIGFGDVGSNKLFPRLIKKAHEAKTDKLKVVILDVKERQIIESKISQYDIRGIPLEIYTKNTGFEESDIDKIFKENNEGFDYVVSYISSPNKTHVKYIMYSAPRSNIVLVEKPLVETMREASLLKETLNDEDRNKIRLIDHYIFKDAVIHFIENYSKWSEGLGNIKKVEFYLLESDPIRESRAWLYQSGLVRDLLPHFLSIVLRLKEKHGFPFNTKNLEIISVRKGVYNREVIPEKYRSNPKETYAALKFSSDDIIYTAEIGKGVGVNKKQLRIIYSGGALVVDTIKNEVRLELNGGIKVLYSKEVERYHEYDNISSKILGRKLDIGLSFEQAVFEVDILDRLDKYPIDTNYELGTKPQINL